MHGPIKFIKQLWSTTNFETQELSQYARKELLDETRKGVMAMCMLLLGLIIFALPVYVELNLHPIYLYIYSLLAG